MIRFLLLQRKENQQLGILGIAMKKTPQILLDCHKHHQFCNLERFVVLLYDRSSSLLSVNEARRWLFTKKRKTVETIPPPPNAWVQHILRAVYQTGFVWKTGLEKQQNLPDVKEWGWKCNDYSHGYEPLWITIPEVLKSLSELKKCKCAKLCSM